MFGKCGIIWQTQKKSGVFMKKNLLLPVLLAALSLMLAGCFCGHESWLEPDCTTPRTCADCGKTEGDPAGHSWQEAICEAPKTCDSCGLTEGEALGHDWQEAACETPETCSRCGKTEGEPIGHHWHPATTENPQTCDLCGKTDGERIITDPRFTTAANEPLFGLWEGVLTVPAASLELDIGIHGEMLELHYQVAFNNDGTMHVSRSPVDEDAFIHCLAAVEAEKIYRLFEWDGYTRGEAEAAIRKTYNMTMEEYVAEQMGDVNVEAIFRELDRSLVYYLEGETLYCAPGWDSAMAENPCRIADGVLELALDGAEPGRFDSIIP